MVVLPEKEAQEVVAEFDRCIQEPESFDLESSVLNDFCSVMSGQNMMNDFVRGFDVESFGQIRGDFIRFSDGSIDVVGKIKARIDRANETR